MASGEISDCDAEVECLAQHQGHLVSCQMLILEIQLVGGLGRTLSAWDSGVVGSHGIHRLRMCEAFSSHLAMNGLQGAKE